MTANEGRNGRETVATLQQMLNKPPPSGDMCDLCSVSLTPDHSHLIELAARRIMCACRPCYIVFQPEGAAQGRYRPIPSRYRQIEEFALDDAAWDALQVPIGLVFLFYNSIEKRTIAFYPGPAGATESMLPLEEWNAIIAEFPVLGTIEPDVEAILIQRNREISRCFIVPVDSAYELVGLMRTCWKGFDGGQEAHAKIAEYFEKIGQRSRRKVTARTS